jgi:RHS repeat-associated protein
VLTKLGASVIEQIYSSPYQTPYKFSGKEKDEESGYSYFGARYYDADLSVWLSVDPMAGKYPELSSYMYCAGNPVLLVDPDGKDVRISLWTSIFHPKAAKAYRNMLKSTVGIATFLPYMNERQAKRYAGRVNYQGKYSNQVDVIFRGRSVFNMAEGNTSMTVKTESGVYDFSNLTATNQIQDFTATSKISLSISVKGLFRSLGKIAVTVAHETGLHAGGLLHFAQSVYNNPDNFNEIRQERLSSEDPDITLDAVLTHYNFGQDIDPELYSEIRKIFLEKLSKTQREIFIKVENSARETYR